MGNKFGAFLAGSLAGAAIALLYAPRSGQETRAMVTEKMSSAWGEAQELGAQASANAQQAYQEAAAKGQNIVQNVAEKGQEWYGTATSCVQEATESMKPAFSEKNDELREKIEAARQRIASQVAKNAEAARDKAGEKIPVAAEEVQGFADTAKETPDQVAEKVAPHESCTCDQPSEASEVEASQACACEAPAEQQSQNGAQ